MVYKDYREIEKSIFIDGLCNYDIEKIRSVSKTDMHIHCTRGGSIEDLSLITKIRNNPFKSIKEMEQWYDKNIAKYYSGIIGNKEKLIEASLIQLVRENIKVANISFGYSNIMKFGGIDFFSNTINKKIDDILIDTKLYKELGLRYEMSQYEIEYITDIIKNTSFFDSIDISGINESNKVKKFAKIYEIAREKGMILRAHIGEFGSSSDVLEVIKKLGLHTIIHGFSIVESKECMRYISTNNINVCVCPMSNLMLGLCKDIKKHPIKKMVENEIKVSICSDDQLLWNGSISKEYLNLYINGVLNEEQLNMIREESLMCF